MRGGFVPEQAPENAQVPFDPNECGNCGRCGHCDPPQESGIAHMVEVSEDGVHVCRVCGFWGMSMPPVPCTGRPGARLSGSREQSDFDTLKATLRDQLDIENEGAAQDCANALWFAGFRMVAPPDAEITSVESGCTCGGMAACGQCQERDAMCGKDLGPTERCPEPRGHDEACWQLAVRRSPALDDPTVFIGSIALIEALYETYVQHIGITETEGPDGPYIWCACGWRSDDLPGRTSPGEGYAVHLTNAQHAAAVVALQPIVRRVTS